MEGMGKISQRKQEVLYTQSMTNAPELLSRLQEVDRCMELPSAAQEVRIACRALAQTTEAESAEIAAAGLDFAKAAGGVGDSASNLRLHLCLVVSWIEAGVVSRAVNPNPVSPVDPLTILSDRTNRESAGHLKPPVLRSSNVPDLPRDFRQILVLAEDYGNIVGVLPGQSDHVDGDADVDALLFAREITVFRATGQANNLVPVDKGPGVDGGATPAEVGELVGPEVVPEGVIFTVGNTRVEAHLGKFPPMRIRDGGRQRDGIRSEEHTSELQSRQYLVCRLLLEKNKNK